jgi:hypothetical protein
MRNSSSYRRVHIPLKDKETGNRSGKSGIEIESDSNYLPRFYMIAAVMKAVTTYFFRGQVLLVLRATAITELASAVFTWRPCLMYFCHINRADSYAGHTSVKV